MNGFKNGYTIVQELLQDPYIINGRKTNMRFYILVICKGNDIDVYVYNDGFMYYTKKPFKKNSTEMDVNVTTGYIDRKVYEQNPLTHKDLKHYLDDGDRHLSEIEANIRGQGMIISQIYFERIYQLLREVFESFVGNINTNRKFHNNIVFQLFGADIEVDNQLQPHIHENNKGPDMSAKDGKGGRDYELKHAVTEDVMKLLGAIPNYNNGFIKILDVTNGYMNNVYDYE
jgi:tubulin polyglutamylase TTLL4